MSYKFDSDVRYTKNDEWVRLEGDIAVCGISDYAQDQLSDIVYVELPEVDQSVSAGEAIAVVESVKAAADVYAPLSGKIVAINDQLDATPELINQDPFGEAWLFKIAPSDLSELDALMDVAAYQEYVAGREE